MVSLTNFLAEAVCIVWVHTNRRNLSVHPVTFVNVTITVHSLAADLGAFRGGRKEDWLRRELGSQHHNSQTVDSDKTTAVTMDEFSSK